jgi:glycosyltransferase involved in cell wall biosynthesis
MNRFLLLMLAIAAALGFWMGMEPAPAIKTKKGTLSGIAPNQEVPFRGHKSFAFVVYAYNQSLWCERILRSLFEQDYDAYRVILVDDASSDDTSQKVRDFVVNNQQEERVILIRNEARLGPVGSLHRAIEGCSDLEIVIPLDAKDWLAHPSVLKQLDLAYQNPDVWMVFGQSISYPSYQISAISALPAPEPIPCSFYSALFKQVRLSDLFQKGEFSSCKETYLHPLIELSGGRYRLLPDPLVFSNCACPTHREKSFPPPESYEPLAQFPHSKAGEKRADILLFSFDRPLQLYACLESISRYMTGFEKISVLLRVSDPSFAAGYEKVWAAFPKVRFIVQSQNPKKDFKNHVLKILFDSPSEYILFGVDDIVMKDFVDLKGCMSLLEKTDAYGFYLRFGKHIRYCYQFKQPQEVPPSVSLAPDVYAWDLKRAEGDWAFPNNLDMTLFRKSQIRTAFETMKYKTPNSLEFNWAKEYAPKRAVGLYFDLSKMVNIPLNVVSQTGNPHMNYLDPQELLAKFNQGLKIDIEPLYKVENSSPHFDYIPEFVPR